MPFLFSLLVLVVILGLAYWCVTLLPIPPPFKQVALVIIIVICLLYLLGILFGAVAPFPVVRHY
jgi:heme A synthase